MLFDLPVCASDAKRAGGVRVFGRFISVRLPLFSCAVRVTFAATPLVLILPCSSEWPHVLKLFLRRLQPLAQALDVFIVRLVLLLVHFQQRPQDFDAMPFFCHTLSVFELA